MAIAISQAHASRWVSWSLLALAACVGPLLPGCALQATPQPTERLPHQVQMPLLRGWFEGLAVFYITTDASDAVMAKEKGGNFAPRLALAIPPTKVPSSVDKVYGFTNFEQGSVFASAPNPVGFESHETAYSPLWRLVKVTWTPGANKHLLTSEEAVLDAMEKGWVTLEATPVVLNCPIIYREALGSLRGINVDGLR